MVAGKRSAGAIGAMQPRRKPDDQQASGRVAKWRHRSGEIIRMFGTDAIKESGQPVAAPAVGSESIARTRFGWFHISFFDLPETRHVRSCQ